MKKMLAGVAVAALAASGCATDANDGNQQVDGLGSLEAKLTLPAPSAVGGSFDIPSVDYTISGNGVSQSDTIDVSNSSSLVFQVGNLPVADDYTMTLNASATFTGGSKDGDVEPCTGGAQFDITDTGVTSATMTLVCGGSVTVLVDDAGDIRYDVDITVGPDVVCPVVTGITALPAAVDVGSSVELTGAYAGTPDSLAWTSGSDGSFLDATMAMTDYTCATTGTKTLTFTTTTAGCSDSTQTVDIVCETPVGVTVETTCDDGIDNDGDGDVDCADADCASDVVCQTPSTETVCDDGIDDDADGDVDCADSDCAGDAACASIVDPTCDACVAANCNDYQGSGIDLADACFNGADPGTGNSTPQPTFGQLCTDAYSCSVLSTDGCAQDVTGPARCACGSATLAECQNNGPAADAQCDAEWNAASECPAGDWACVLNTFTDLTLPSGFVNFTIECTNSNCATECF